MPQTPPRKLLITAGPTREPLDKVRYLTNRSSGRLGVALARAGLEAGHPVTLLLGPIDSAIAAPGAAHVHRFETTAQLQQLLRTCWPEHDILIMAAAVADYRAARPHEGKLPRNQNGLVTLELEPTPDLVAEAAATRRPDQRVVAFALESPDVLLDRATEKLQRKGVDAIVANPLETMDSSRIEGTLLLASGLRDRARSTSKRQFADWLIGKLGNI